MYLKNIKKLYQCILFNDVLVFAHGDSRQSKVELQLNLEAMWFEDLEDLDPQTSKKNLCVDRVMSSLDPVLDMAEQQERHNRGPARINRTVVQRGYHQQQARQGPSKDVK